MKTTGPEDLEATQETEGGREVPIEKRGAAALSLVEPAQYELKKELGQGGMGRVVRAHDQRLDRDVALKELLPTSREAIPRFIREALVTARLQHPSILPIYEIGRWPSGKPFYSMKLIQGRSLGETIFAQKSLSARLTLIPRVLDACEAMAYAHAEGIIHRDLKPDNVMLGAFGETIVIDWGLAKDLNDKTAAPEEGAPLANSPAVTAAGRIMGTPAYMPLEQAHGQPLDARADVYSLGAILYETLSGQAPYQGQSTADVLLTLHQRAPTPLKELAPRAPRELLAIVEKAMARKREERYPTARELANDLQRFQEGQLVAAYEYTTAERLRRWVKQHRATLGLSAAALTALVVMGLLSYAQIKTERDRALEAQQREAEARALEAARADELRILQAKNELTHDPAAALRWLSKLSEGSPQWRQARLIAADAVERGLSSVLSAGEGPVEDLALSPDGEWLASGSDRALWLQRVGQPTQRISLSAHQAGLSRVVFSPDGAWLASADESGLVVRWEMACVQRENNESCREILSGHRGEVLELAFSPDHQWLASAGKDGEVRFWGAAQGICEGHSAAVRKLVFLADGRRLLSASDDGTLRLWERERCRSAAAALVKSLPSEQRPNQALNPPTREDAVAVLQGHSAEVLDFVIAPNQQTVYSVSQDQSLRAWSLETKRDALLYRGRSPLTTIALSGDAARLAVGDAAGEVLSFEVASLQSKPPPKKPAKTLASNNTKKPEPVTAKDPKLPDEKRRPTIDNTKPLPSEKSPSGSGNPLPSELVTSLSNHAASEAPKVQAAAAKGAPTPVVNAEALPGHTDAVLFLSFSKDNNLLLSASRDKSVSVYSFSQRQRQLFVGHQDRITQALFLDGAKSLVTSSWDHTVRRWALEERQRRQEQLPAGAIASLGYLESAERQLRIGAAGTRLYLWEEGKTTPKMIENNATLSTFEVSADGALLAVGGLDGSLRLYETKSFSARRLGDANQSKSTIMALAFTQDGKLLASIDQSKGVWLWDNSGKGGLLAGMESAATSVAFSPDGAWLAAADAGGVLYLWRVSDRSLQTLKAHSDAINVVRFSPDGSVLASGSEDRSVCVVALSAPLSCERLTGHGLGVLALAFSPDGRSLLSGGFDRVIRRWELAKKTSIEWAGHRGKINALTFLHQGQEALSLSDDGQAYLWDVASGQPRALRTESAQQDFALSTDERSLFILSQDGTIRRFQDDLPEEEAALKKWIVENSTQP